MKKYSLAEQEKIRVEHPASENYAEIILNNLGLELTKELIEHLKLEWSYTLVNYGYDYKFKTIILFDIEHKFLEYRFSQLSKTDKNLFWEKVKEIETWINA